LNWSFGSCSSTIYTKFSSSLLLATRGNFLQIKYMDDWFGERGLRTKPIQKAKMKLYKYRIRLFDTGEVGDSFSIWNSPRVLNTNNMCTAIWIVIFTRLLYICCILYLEKYSRHEMDSVGKK
jgi:hypothetical protein